MRRRVLAVSILTVGLCLKACSIDEETFDERTRELTCARAAECAGLDYDTCLGSQIKVDDPCWRYDRYAARTCLRAMANTYAARTCDQTVGDTLHVCHDVWVRRTTPECAAGRSFPGGRPDAIADAEDESH